MVTPTGLLPRGRGRRHAHLGEGRAHVQVRRPPPQDADRFHDRLRRRLQALDGVRWVETAGMVGHVVVAFEGGDAAMGEVLDAVDEVEGEFDLLHQDLDDGVVHPADPRVIRRGAARVGASAMALALASARPLLAPVRLPWLGYAATGAAFLEHMPRLHRAADAVLGHGTAEVVLAAADAIGQGLTQSPLGPLVDLAHRNGELRASRARRDLWLAHESLLYAAGPAGHPAPTADEARPVPVPPGVVERLADRELLISIGGAGVSLAATGGLAFGTGLLYAGLPKAAVYGRDAFTAHIGRILARRDLLLPLNLRALSLLDRVDCLILDEQVLFRTPTRPGQRTARLGAHRVIEDARASGLHVAIGGRPTAARRALAPDRFLPGGDDIAASVRTLQADGGVVLAVAPGGSPALRAADVGLGLRQGAGPPPLEADVLALDDDLVHVSALVAAAAHARRASRQDAAVARVGAVAGVVAGLLGLPAGASNRALDAVNAATVVALANSFRLAVHLDRATAAPQPVEVTSGPARLRLAG